jgi:hypothetical protein
MPEFTPRAVRVPGCIPRELAQPMEKLAELANRVAAGDTINMDVTTIQGETPEDLHDAEQLTGDLPATIIAGFAGVGTLGGTLARDGTQTLNLIGGGTIEVDGYFIPDRTPAVVAPNGARCGALKFGNTYYAIVIDRCVEEA